MLRYRENEAKSKGFCRNYYRQERRRALNSRSTLLFGAAPLRRRTISQREDRFGRRLRSNGAPGTWNFFWVIHFTYLASRHHFSEPRTESGRKGFREKAIEYEYLKKKVGSFCGSRFGTQRLHLGKSFLSSASGHHFSKTETATPTNPGF